MSSPATRRQSTAIERALRCETMQLSGVEGGAESSRFPVAVIMPVRNEEHTIRRVIESLLNQNTMPREIVIADGGSTDRTREIISGFEGGKVPLLLVEDEDAYPGRARNLAIRSAREQWIAMTDAGTQLDPGWLEALIRSVNDQPDVDVVLGTYEPVLGSFFKDCLALAFVAPAARIDKGWVRGPSTASLMIKKSVWQELGGFPEHLRACEDLLFFERLAGSGHKIAVQPEAVVRWSIPDSFAAAFRRFRAYSMHTLRAGLGGRWHLAVARMYFAGMVVVGLAFFHHWSWVLIALFGLAWRVWRTIRARRPSLKLTRAISLRTYLGVGVILLWIDLAAFVGCIDCVLSGESG
jgi:cellulose synthase/poly-beta-1,6-N-acetylglucosamine synthase-like glycosyltransferase